MKLWAVSIFFWSLLCAAHEQLPTQEQSFKLGVENITPEQMAILQRHSIGLVANHTSKTQQGHRTLDLLIAHGVPVKALLVPEHGFTGIVGAGKEVVDDIDTVTGVPIVSLYGKGTGKKICPKKLSHLDLIIIDLQDCGMRHYTYISTVMNMLAFAADHDKKIVICDRPNPLGGIMEGALVDEELHSFISIAPIPLRHGLTLAELATFFVRFCIKKPLSMEIIPMAHFDRNKPCVVDYALSPNIKTQQSCYGYSFLGLLGEVRPCDVALTTDKAFQCIMLPNECGVTQQQWFALHEQLKNLGINSSFYTYFSERKKKQCSGLHISIADITAVSCCRACMTIVQFFKSAGVPLTFSADFDKAAGTSLLKQFLQGNVPQQTIAQHIDQQLQQFASCTKDILLYGQAPTIKYFAEKSA